MMNEKTLEKLEYQKILAQVAIKTRSALAKSILLSFKPQSDINEIELLLKQTGEAIEYANSAISPDFTFDDATAVIDKARISSTLSMRELLFVMRLLKTSRQLKESIKNYKSERVALLRSMAEGLYSNKAFEEQIDFCIISQDEMNDRASEKLFTIRKKIKKANADIRETLQKYMRSKELAPFMQDAIVTVREGRYVIPVKQEYKSAVKGIVHDQSSSGLTVFVEPLAVVNLNNDIKVLTIEEGEEIERILIEFTNSVRGMSDSLANNQKIIAQLDIIFARANYAIDCRAICPRVNEKGYVNLIKARHPLLNKDNIIPLTINLGKTFRIVVITGPNTGGKTVSLKTIGLFCLMAYSGLFLPADEGSEVAVFDDIFCDIGDEQSIEQSLSTFSSHMTNIKSITQRVTQKSLVLFDELGAGTEPNEGTALALAITEFVLSAGCRAVLTTHYGQLKEFSMVTEGVENACMEFDSETFAPTYKLILGVPGSSNAIEIASRLGLSKSIIDSARSKLSSEKMSFEKILQQAERVRQENERQKEEVMLSKKELHTELQKAKEQNKLLLEEREKLLAKTQQEVKQVVREAKEEAEALVQELKDIMKRAEYDDSTLFKARSLVKQVSDLKYSAVQESDEKDYFIGEAINLTQAQEGDSVYVMPLKSVGKIISFDLKKNTANVRVWGATTTVAAADLYQSKDVSPQKTYEKTKTTINTAAVSSEINLLGQRVLEAMANVDDFLDLASRSGLTEVRIVHGVGTGRLREGLHQHFRNHPLIESYRLGKYGEGEGGVTIIKLK